VWPWNQIFYFAAELALLILEASWLINNVNAAGVRLARAWSSSSSPYSLCGGGQQRLLDWNRIGSRKGILEGFVKRLFLAPTLAAMGIILMGFVLRLGDHFDFSDRTPEDSELLRSTNLTAHMFPRKSGIKSNHANCRFLHGPRGWVGSAPPVDAALTPLISMMINLETAWPVLCRGIMA
jgi:hypothetical protein